MAEGDNQRATARIRELEADNARLRQAHDEAARELARLRGALDAMPGALYVVDSNLELVLVSDRYRELYGHPPGLVVPGRPIADVLRYEMEQGILLGEGDGEKILADRLASLRRREADRFEDLTPDGRRIRGSRHPAPENHLLTVLADVTDDRRAEAALAETETRARAILDSSFQLQGLLSPDGRLLEANEAALAMIAARREDVIGKPFWDCPWWSREPEIQARLRDAVRRAAVGERVQFIAEHPTPAGELRYVDFRITPVRNRRGEVIMLLPEGHDITELKRTEEALRIARDQAEAATRAKATFLANMSHEIRTPMNAILGFAQLLQRDRTLGDRHRGMIEIINRSGEHLLGLISDVMDMSKIEAGHMRLSEEKFDLWQLLDDVEQMFGSRNENPATELLSDRGESVPRYVRGDRCKIKQILINLLGNALKFTDRGSVDLSADLLRREDDLAEVEFVVRDTGVGLAEEQLESIFNAFEQTDAGRRAGGTGLGLAISRRMAELMGGSLRVESTPGHGSGFILSLPLQVATRQNSADDADRDGPCLADGRAARRVLIVDDNEINRELIRELIEPLGLTPLEADNGSVAVERFSRHRPDIVLMDVVMPVMGGVEAVRRIRRLPGGAGATVIALTANTSEDELDAIRRAGCDDVLPKPVLFDQLVAALQRYVRIDFEHEQARAGAAGGARPASTTSH